MAALAVGPLVMPYAKQLACGLTDHGAVASHQPSDVEGKSSDGSDDGGGCHDSLTCNLDVLREGSEMVGPRKTA